MTSKIPVTVSFEEVEKLVYYVVHEAVNKFMMDFDAVLSEAFLGFMQAFDKFNPKLNIEFSTFVAYLAKKRILDLRRKLSKERVPVDLDLTTVPMKERTFDFAEWRETISKNSQLVADLAIDPPIDIRATIAELGADTAANMRAAIREFLRESGWGDKEIKLAFREIRES